MRPYAPLLALALAGCGLLAPSGERTVVAHRGGAGYHPENSRAGITEALTNRRWAAIEFDVVVTKDRRVVLSHDPWINETNCRKADGSEIGAEILIKDLTLDELRAGYRCGGVPDEKMIAAGKALKTPPPAPKVIAETHMEFAELLALAKDRPEVVLHVDLKYEPENTLSAETFAEEITKALKDAGVTNPWYTTTAWPEAVAAFKAKGARVFFQWPRFGRPRSDTVVGLEGELLQTFGLAELADKAIELGADGVSVPYQLVDRRAAEIARGEGLAVLVWTMNTDAQLETYCDFPADYLITDFPESAPCR